MSNPVYNCNVCKKDRSFYLTKKKVLFEIKGIPVIGYICKYCENTPADQLLKQIRKDEKEESKKKK